AAEGADAAMTIGTGVAAGIVAVMLPVAWATLAVAGLAAASAAWLTHEVGAGVWMATLRPALAAAFALFAGVAWQYFIEGREKRAMKRLFGRYVSRDVFDHLEADPS